MVPAPPLYAQATSRIRAAVAIRTRSFRSNNGEGYMEQTMQFLW
jgi:hypothetical protein